MISLWRHSSELDTVTPQVLSVRRRNIPLACQPPLLDKNNASDEKQNQQYNWTDDSTDDDRCSIIHTGDVLHCFIMLGHIVYRPHSHERMVLNLWMVDGDIELEKNGKGEYLT